MVYREMGRTGVKVSALGYGCMRYPRKGGRVDVAAHRAAASERARPRRQLFRHGLGLPWRTERNHPRARHQGRARGQEPRGGRDELYVADKIPPYLVFSRKDMDRIFETMLRRLGAERIDFLLAHALGDFAHGRG